MKKALIALLGALPLAACAGGYYGGPAGPADYDGFYDDYYGPIYDGYWGDGGVFYYRGSARGHFRADRGGHFRHDMGPGGQAGPGAMGGGHAFHPMHGTFSGMHGGGGGRHR